MESKNYTEEQLREMSNETRPRTARGDVEGPLAGFLGGCLRRDSVRDGRGIMEVNVDGYVVGWLEVHEPAGEDGPVVAVRFYPRTDHQPRADEHAGFRLAEVTS